MKFKSLIVLLALCSGGLQIRAQQKNLAEKLGLPKDAKLLIVHADDVGFCQSVDSATFAAIEKKAINSASIMVPCPWFPEVAAYAKKHPEFDWGIHVTFTAEGKGYKWSTILPATQVPSLLDSNGYMYATNIEVAKSAKPAEVEKEIRSEIERALSFGIPITHIDNHMGSILNSPELIGIYQRIGKEYKLPVLIPMNLVNRMSPQMVKYIDTSSPFIVDNYMSAYPTIPAGNWKQFYAAAIQNIKPGLNELIFHLGFDTNELKAVMGTDTPYGSAWRQRDFDFATSDEFKTLLKQYNITLITWRDIQKAIYK